MQQEERVGFTGTQKGMTARQLAVLQDLLWEKEPVEFHHGDCIGADEQADANAISVCTVVIHPPTDSKKRAFCHQPLGSIVKFWTIIRNPKPYLVRNHDIVDETTCLIATPRQMKPVKRSGTWSTVRYALQRGRRVAIVYPDGSVDRRNGF